MANRSDSLGHHRKFIFLCIITPPFARGLSLFMGFNGIRTMIGVYRMDGRMSEGECASSGGFVRMSHLIEGFTRRGKFPKDRAIM